MKIHLNKIEEFLTTLISAFGVLWLFVEITDYFTESDFGTNNIKPYWWVFALSGLGYAIFKVMPKTKFVEIVPNRGAKIVVVCKDIFKIKGSLIVPVNNKFLINQDGNLLKSKSILSQVVIRYYSGKPELLQAEINAKLRDEFYESYKEGAEYKIGTVVHTEILGEKFYFLANTKLNERSKSYCDDEMFETSLNELWVFLQECASKEDYVIPLIGTGNGRLITERQIVFQEILLSFLSSLSSKNYVDSLTICIHPKAISDKIINFNSCIEFAKAKIKYQEYRNKNAMPNKAYNVHGG